jgi:hypothetical protein
MFRVSKRLTKVCHYRKTETFYRLGFTGIRVLLAGMLALNCPSVSGQNPANNSELFRLNLQNWYRSTVDPSRGTELILFVPSMPIDPALTSNDPIVSQRTLLLLTDMAPLPTEVFAPSGRKTYDVYKTILDHRAIEIRKLSKDEERRLKRATNVLLARRCLLTKVFRKLIGKPSNVEYSSEYTAYWAFLSRYAELETQLLLETDLAKRAELTTAMQITLDQWVRKGHKEKVEGALKDFREITAQNPERFWSEVSTEYSRNVRIVGGAHLPMTRLEPAARAWTDVDGWNPWHSGDSTGFIKLASINRQWLRTEVLTTHAWSWGDGTFKRDNVLISDGLGLMTRNARDQLMPLLPISLVLAKNVVIAGQPLIGTEPVIVGVVCSVLPRLPTR